MAFILSLRSRGLTDQRVLNAVSTLPRPIFVLAEHAALAWEDIALADPMRPDRSRRRALSRTIAERLEVEPNHRVLEIGTGSGYLTAVLARLSRRVLTLDRWRTLDHRGGRAAAGRRDPQRHHDGRGRQPGLGAHAPFDRIVTTAALPAVPQPLLDQLAPGGRLIAPIGGKGEAQRLVMVEKGEGARPRPRSCR